MRKHIQILVAMFVLAFTGFSCSIPSATAVNVTPMPQAEVVLPQQPPFVGLWMSETEALIFTQKNLYRIQSNAETGQTNEQFAEIIAHDVPNSRLTLRIQWVKVNGISVGFDAPVYSLSYKVDGDILQIGLGTASEFSTEFSPTIYYRK